MSKQSKKTGCDTCPLKSQKDAGYFVPGEGLEGFSDVMIIGEAPGKQEAKEKKPFVGQSGQVLREIIGKVVPADGSYYITNAVKCWPGEGNPTPSAKAISCCREAYLLDELKTHTGDRVLLVGKIAVQSVTHRKSTLKKLIGLPFQVEGFTHWFLAMWHPAYYLYSHNTQIYREMYRSVKFVMNKWKEAT